MLNRSGHPQIGQIKDPCDIESLWIGIHSSDRIDRNRLDPDTREWFETVTVDDDRDYLVNARVSTVLPGHEFMTGHLHSAGLVDANGWRVNWSPSTNQARGHRGGAVSGQSHLSDPIQRYLEQLDVVSGHLDDDGILDRLDEAREHIAVGEQDVIL